VSTSDKISNKGEELQGKVKEGVGEATDDKDLKAEGKGDQAKGNLKQAPFRGDLAVATGHVVPVGRRVDRGEDPPIAVSVVRDVRLGTSSR